MAGMYALEMAVDGVVREFSSRNCNWTEVMCSQTRNYNCGM